MNQSGSDDENFYLNPTFLSFNNISDKSVLSDTFLSKNCLGETPITRSDSDSSFADKYLVVQTPETPEIDPIQPYFTKTVLSHAEIDEQIVSARQNIKFNSESLKKVTFSTSTPSIINSSSKYRSIAVMEKLGTCRKFAGYPKDNGTKFLREFESFCKLHELDILNEKTVAAFHLHLEGPALTWFNGLSPDLSWTTVKRLFTDRYVQIGWQHPSVVIESETFHNMQLGPTQEIEDFSCQVLEKGQILAKPEHEIMFRFINGLPEKLAFYVRTSHPKTQSEALSFAKAGEAYKYRIHEQCAAVGKGPSFRNAQSEDISEMKSQIYELTSMMKKLTPDKAFQQSDQRQSSGCYNCSCTGHAKRYCNWNGSGTISAEISCQLCNQSGHGAGQCLKFKVKTDNYNRNRVVCQICSKPNHTASECYHNQFAQQGNPNFLGDTRHGPSGSFSENSSYSDNDTSEFYSDNENFSIAQTDSKFIYLHVKFHSVHVAALLDSGSSINIMSTSLYNSIPQACKSMIDVNNGDNIKLANDQNVQVKGTATVKMYYKGDKHCLQVYILEQTSHPFILGTSYLKDNKITIDFGESEVVQKHANIRCQKRITLDPHSEIIIWGRLPRNIHFGYQGMCESSTQILSHGLISSKAVVTVSQDRTVPVKILNPGSNSVVIPKGKIIAKFSQLTEEYQVRHVNCTNNVPVVQNINLVKQCPTEQGDSIDCEFLENFEINPTLKDDQKIALNHLLCDNKEVFVTTDRPNLGCTDIAQHHIILKPDMRPLHQNRIG
ncbi:unnamed protein product [Mytilus coruscus]|uniref:CCHC-type domain-containing protein n=1 Tax=Mytilus coruscus TaxID=42192 RepID=A0A6J8CFY3_MYTCO|nr:unnamed protein product [Mytilus coruscus]